MLPFELSTDQLNDFMSRNWTLPEVISNAIQTGYWPNSGTLQQGFTVTDSVYGNVLISADANGYMHYIAQSTIAASVSNSEPYTSDSGNSVSQSISDLVSGVTTYAKEIAIGVGLYLLWTVIRK